MEALVKLKIQTDRKAGIVRAYIAMTDGSQQVEISTFNLSVLQEHEQNFEDWKAALCQVMKRMVERVAGVLVERMEDRVPNEN